MNGLVLFAVLLVPYLLPSVIAYRRWHKNFKAIFALNILLGWTLLGWIVCLVWSFTSDTKSEKTDDAEIKNIAKKFFVVSADTKERIQGFYTDDGALKCIDENGLSVTNVSKNAEGGMDFVVGEPN
jgi:hypothetical protein